MKKILTLSIFAPLFALALIFATPAPEASAASKKKTQSNPYSYTVQEGDTYSQIARKAVQTYGIRENIKLTDAAIIFAETNLTQQAGSPELTVGQKITVEKSSLKKVVSEAKNLTNEQQAAWQTYVPYVDFNTNTIGQTPRQN